MGLPGLYKEYNERWAQQTVWIYSDPHFSDEDLECGIKNRPSDAAQIASINSCVGRKDTLIILGDVGNIECVRQLRAGRKVLIMGNHDTGSTKYKREVKTFYFDQDKYTREDVYALMVQEYPNWRISVDQYWKTELAPFNYWTATVDNMLFDEVYEGALIIGEKIILSHEPVNIPWLFNFHGHDHNRRNKGDANHLNCCSDVIGYKPIHLNQFFKTGPTAKIDTIHRLTIDKATEKKRKKGK